MKYAIGGVWRRCITIFLGVSASYYDVIFSEGNNLDSCLYCH